MNNGARFVNADGNGGSEETFTGLCLNDTSREEFSQCQWEGEGGVVQVAGCGSESACPENNAPCSFNVGAEAAECAA